MQAILYARKKKIRGKQRAKKKKKKKENIKNKERRKKDDLSAGNTLSNVRASGATRRPLVSRRRMAEGWIFW